MAGSTTQAQAAYGLHAPTLDDARVVVAAICPDEAERRWTQLLTAAGLKGDEQGPDAVARIAAAMSASDRLLQLAALSLTIRSRSHEQLSAARDIIEGVR